MRSRKSASAARALMEWASELSSNAASRTDRVFMGRILSIPPAGSRTTHSPIEPALKRRRLRVENAQHREVQRVRADGHPALQVRGGLDHIGFSPFAR